MTRRLPDDIPFGKLGPNFWKGILCGLFLTLFIIAAVVLIWRATP